MLTFRNRIYRSPEGDVSGGSVAEAAPDVNAPVTGEVDGVEAQPQKASKTEGNAAPKKAPSDRDLVDKTAEKFRKNPNYQMSDEEHAAYERWEKTAHKPGPKPKNDLQKAEAARKKVEAEQVDGAVETEDETDAETPVESDLEDDDESETQPTKVPKGFEKLIGEKSLLGAKSLDELPAKVEGLLSKFKELQGKDNPHKVEKLETSLRKQHEFLEDFLKGDPNAIAYAKRKFGWNGQLPGEEPKTERPARAARNNADFDRFLDPDLAQHVQSRFDTMEATYKARLEELENKTKHYDQQRDTELAREQVMAEISALSEKFSELKPNGASIRQLMKEYYQGGDNDPVDPRVQPFLDVMKIAAREGLNNLETAYKVWAHEGHAKALIAAQAKGRAEIASHKPSVGLSDHQGRNSGQFKQYSQADFEAMTRNPDLIPEEWMDRNGTLIQSRLPKQLREMFASNFSR